MVDVEYAFQIEHHVAVLSSQGGGDVIIHHHASAYGYRLKWIG